jgi:hypothetical protein
MPPDAIRRGPSTAPAELALRPVIRRRSRAAGADGRAAASGDREDLTGQGVLFGGPKDRYKLEIRSALAFG